LIKEIGKVSLLCHHGAEVGNYKSIDFDIPGGLNNNTFRLNKTLELLQNPDVKK